MVLVVQFGLCDQLSRRGSMGKGPHEGLSPLLENLGVRRIPSPTFAHHGHAAILRHHPCQNSLLQVWPVVFARAVGDGHGLLGAFGDIGATEGKAGRGEMMAALFHAFLDPDG